MSGSNSVAPLPSPSAPQSSTQTPYGQQFAVARPSPSPGPLIQPPSYGSHGSGSHSAMPQTPLYQPQNAYNQYAPATTPVTQQPNPLATYNHYQSSHNASRPAPPLSTSHTTHANAYNPPRPTEVYTLAEAANSSIPADIRAQFHHDEYGKVIFFTAPPLDVDPVPEDVQSLGHSLRYLADKARHKEEDEKKRRAREFELESAAIERLKRVKHDDEGKENWIRDQKLTSLKTWAASMEKRTDELYQQLHGEDWRDVRKNGLSKIAVRQEQSLKEQQELQSFRRERDADKDIQITGFKWA